MSEIHLKPANKNPYSWLGVTTVVPIGPETNLTVGTVDHVFVDQEALKVRILLGGCSETLDFYEGLTMHY
jgi:hypothetical protein